MARIGIKGLVVSDTQRIGNVDVPSIPVLDWLFAQIHNAVNGQLDNTNLATGGVATANLADASVTAIKLAASSVTSAATVDGIGLTASGTWTGDGTTASRQFNVGFTPRYVLAMRTGATFIEFLSIQNGGTTQSWYRDSTGTVGALVTNWAGIITNGFQLGTNAAGTANVAATVYQYVCWK